MAVNLKKGQKVSLKKRAQASLGEVLVNLNWNAGPKQQGFLSGLFSGSSSGIDLDLGCLYELKNGGKGTVQALGNAFGSLRTPPFIALDGDDRTGNLAAGENLRINGDRISEFKRILVYTFIYEGVANWQQADAAVTVRVPGAEDLIVRMDSFNTQKRMCALPCLKSRTTKPSAWKSLPLFTAGTGRWTRHTAGAFIGSQEKSKEEQYGC